MRKINIWGTGKNAADFIMNNYSEVSVQCVIENKKKLERPFMGICAPVLHSDDADRFLLNYYTIIAVSPNIFWEIKKILDALGLVEFENYEYYDTFNKRICICYGNCHLGSVKAYLRMSADFCDQFGFYPMPQIQDMARESIKISDFVKGLEKCELFIHQSIRKENYFGVEYSSENLLRYLNSRCVIISCPNLYRLPWFMFPQCSSYDTVSVCDMPFSFIDDYIEKTLSEGGGVNDIMDMMLDDKLISSGDLLNREEEFIHKVGEREKEWDIKVKKFLETNIRNKKLFYDMGHPSGHIILFVVNRILQTLKIKEMQTFFVSVNELDFYELPVYECVKKAFGLKFDDTYIRKYNGIKLCLSFVDKKSYISSYIKFRQYGTNTGWR